MDLMENELTVRERIRTRIFDGADVACAEVAASIAALIRERAAAGKRAVLGLATGSTPVRLYRELIRLHREEGLSFANVTTFNLDEYYGLPGDHPEAYRRFMQDQLFEHVDLDPAATHVPDGMAPREEVFARCRAYEEAIREAGGIDVQILGIGRTGHIGFNEPGSSPETRTRLVTLDSLTRRDAARDFLGEANVPRHAITMGVGTILAARKIYLLAWGEAKASIIARTVEGDIVQMVELLNELKPHQIFATGFGHDPLSVPALCFEVLRLALWRCRGEEWLPDCRIWLYRGSGQEWEPHQVDMAVPLSPGELETKLQGIYQHQSQRSQSPGTIEKTTNNAWDLARSVNRSTAETYDALGLADYEAIECFKGWTPAGDV